MKLKLEVKSGIQILEVTEDVTKEHGPLLKTGITKLLQSGKNKIILNFSLAKGVSAEVIQDLIPLHKVASELNGGLIFVGHGEVVKTAVQGNLSAVRYFPTIEAALQGFAAQKQEAQEATGVEAELRKHLERLEIENRTLKGKLENSDSADTKELRGENAALKKQVSQLEEQIRVLQRDRKKPVDSDAVQVRIKELEETIKQLTVKEDPEAVPPAAKN
ncbi:MAG: hypothetical protein AB7F43_05550 [Bacteriovoracia bacterium]